VHTAPRRARRPYRAACGLVPAQVLQHLLQEQWQKLRAPRAHSRGTRRQHRLRLRLQPHRLRLRLRHQPRRQPHRLAAKCCGTRPQQRAARQSSIELGFAVRWAWLCEARVGDHHTVSTTAVQGGPRGSSPPVQAHPTKPWHVRSPSRGSCSEGQSHGRTPVNGERAPRVHPLVAPLAIRVRS
jgi:hypothetical protein